MLSPMSKMDRKTNLYLEFQQRSFYFRIDLL